MPPPCPLFEGSAPSEGHANSPGADSPFCHRHRPKDAPAAELIRGLSDFRSVADVTVFLSRLIFALSKDQISTRRAAPRFSRMSRSR